ncbi:hypothetical protein KP509_04G018200 [Ceratopteris richardii]|uniref:DYW domain-containing protein n=1 Tax=Ceratopteris richardii TaxID=49495 RepID=A0A8T2UUZ3_CERRI|nr:hypothetical protein KP509_04G018200 [Ceratopteris richardii]
MAEVIQNSFLFLHRHGTAEVHRNHHLPQFTHALGKLSVREGENFHGTGIHGVEDNNLTPSCLNEQFRLAWKTPVSISFETLLDKAFEGDLRHTLQQVIHLAHEGVQIPSDVLAQLLQLCIERHDLLSGRYIQHIVKACDLNSDAFLGSHLIRMFAAFGCLGEAMEVFKSISLPNVYTWNSIISAHVDMGHFEKAVSLYMVMRESGVDPDGHIFVSVLKAYIGIGKLDQSLWVHLDIIKYGFETEIFVCSTLIDMYTKCGDLEKACQIFSKLPEQNVVTWSVLINAHSIHGYSDKALELFECMQSGGIEPNPFTCTSVLKACLHVEDVMRTHAHIVGHGLESNNFVSSSLVHMYAKCGSFGEAHVMFERLHEQGLLAWSALITNLCHCGHDHAALNVFTDMQCEGIEVNLAIYSCILKSCAELRAFREGFLIHSSLIENNIQLDAYAGSSLINMYSKCGDLRSAIAVFQSLPQQNVVTWSALISGFLQHGFTEEGFECFQQMKQQGVEPNEFTLVSILKACSDLSMLEEGRQIHVALIECGFEQDTFVSNAIIDLYVHCNQFEDACNVFNKLFKRDVVSWSTLMGGSIEHERGEMALQLYSEMLLDGVEPSMITFVTLLRACSSIAALDHGRHLHAQIVLYGLSVDVYISSALIDMYSRCSCLEDSHMVFHRLSKYDTGIWSAMITAYAQHSDYRMAFQYLNMMQRSGLEPDSVTFLCILSACSHSGLVQEGLQHLKAMRDTHHLLPNLEHFNSVVDLLGSSNLLDEARDLLETLPVGANIVGWISLLSSCKKHVNLDIGRECFDHIVTLDGGNVTCYVFMADIYRAHGMQQHAEEIEELRRISNGWKKPGRAFIEVNKEVHRFVVGDRQHPQSEAIYDKLKVLKAQMKSEETEMLVRSDIDQVSQNTEDQLCGHCEKLAVAFGLLHTPQGTTIRVSKNLRMCSFCHMDVKFISKAEKRDIIIVDGCLVHHFQDGICKCNMYDT